jgi:hypothetical protein
VYSEIKISARQVKMQAESMWKEWSAINGLEGHQPSTVALQSAAGHVIDHWIPPRQGYMKCNIDASFYASRCNRFRVVLKGSSR